MEAFYDSIDDFVFVDNIETCLKRKISDILLFVLIGFNKLTKFLCLKILKIKKIQLNIGFKTVELILNSVIFFKEKFNLFANTEREYFFFLISTF